MSSGADAKAVVESYEALDDVVLRISVLSLAEIEGKRLVEENKKYSLIPEYQMPITFDKQIQKEIDKIERKKVFDGLKKITSQVVNRVAMVVLVVSVTLYSTFAVSAKFRDVIYRLLFHEKVRYTEVLSNNEHYLRFRDSDIYAAIDHVHAPMYLPNKFQIYDSYGSEYFFGVEYHDDSGGFIVFIQKFGEPNKLEDSVSLRIDSEDAENVETIYINSSEALLTEKNGISTLTWQVGTTVLSLNATCSREELIMVAENIALMK